MTILVNKDTVADNEVLKVFAEGLVSVYNEGAAAFVDVARDGIDRADDVIRRMALILRSQGLPLDGIVVVTRLFDVDPKGTFHLALALKDYADRADDAEEYNPIYTSYEYLESRLDADDEEEEYEEEEEYAEEVARIEFNAVVTIERNPNVTMDEIASAIIESATSNLELEEGEVVVERAKIIDSDEKSITVEVRLSAPGSISLLRIANLVERFSVEGQTGEYEEVRIHEDGTVERK